MIVILPWVTCKAVSASRCYGRSKNRINSLACNFALTVFRSIEKSGYCRALFYPNFEGSYLLNGLTDRLDFLHGTIIWPCLLMNEVSRNFRQYNHLNQPTYLKISNQRSQKNIPWNFWNFAWTTIHPFNKSRGSCTVITLLLWPWSRKAFFSRYQKHEIHVSFFRCLCISTYWHRKYPRLICQVITCLC